MKSGRFLITLTFLFAITQVQNAQTSISGRVFSQEDRQPLISSTVSVVKAGSGELVTGILTDEAGRFNVSGLTSGEYDFIISYVGYKTVKRNVISGSLNKFLDLGNILLEASGVELSEVQVEAQKLVLC